MEHNLYSRLGFDLKIAIIFIGTGPYIGFLDGFRRRVNKFFCPNLEKKIFAFTDQINDPSLKSPDIETIEIQHVGWPYITLHRFKFIESISSKLEKYDYTFFIDADLWPVDEMKFSDFFEDEEEYKFISVQHPGFIDKQGTFEDNANSTAFAFKEGYDISVYRQGCFWGGETKSILSMVSECSKNVDIDTSNNIIAKWHDESHMNKFFLENIDDVKTMGAGYATPESPGYDFVWNYYDVKMIHLDKDPKTFPRFEGSGN
jgi:hypothetical protein